MMQYESAFLFYACKSLCIEHVLKYNIQIGEYLSVKQKMAKLELRDH